MHLEVKPKPSAWTDGTWLPAASLLLKDETELPDEVHVGDPITRTLRLQAQGLGFEQLPELNLAAPEGAEIYPDKTDTRTRDDGEWLYGERVRKFAFVPNRAGTLTIPGLKLHWWDSEHDRLETAELPPHTVKVLPAAGASSNTPSLPGGDHDAGSDCTRIDRIERLPRLRHCQRQHHPPRAVGRFSRRSVSRSG